MVLNSLMEFSSGINMEFSLLESNQTDIKTYDDNKKMLTNEKLQVFKIISYILLEIFFFY